MSLLMVRKKKTGITKRSYICVNLNSHLQKEPITKIKDIQEMTDTSKSSRAKVEIKQNDKTANKTGQTNRANKQ